MCECQCRDPGPLPTIRLTVVLPSRHLVRVRRELGVLVIGNPVIEAALGAFQPGVVALGLIGARTAVGDLLNAVG
jgi:hypothetical protein